MDLGQGATATSLLTATFYLYNRTNELSPPSLLYHDTEVFFLLRWGSLGVGQNHRPIDNFASGHAKLPLRAAE
jgi:hypothetical protein